MYSHVTLSRLCWELFNSPGSCVDFISGSSLGMTPPSICNFEESSAQ